MPRSNREPFRRLVRLRLPITIVRQSRLGNLLVLLPNAQQPLPRQILSLLLQKALLGVGVQTLEPIT